MKSIFIVTILSTTILSSSANAEDFYFKPYVGADYQFTHVDYQNGVDDVLANNFSGVNFHAGARIHKNLGIETGYQVTQQKEKETALTDSKTDIKGFNVDLLGYLPVQPKIDLIGTIGVSYLTATIKGPGGSDDDDEAKGRIGAGAQYWVNDNLNIRGIVRYQGADFDDAADGAVVANVGANYQF